MMISFVVAVTLAPWLMQVYQITYHPHNILIPAHDKIGRIFNRLVTPVIQTKESQIFIYCRREQRWPLWFYLQQNRLWLNFCHLIIIRTFNCIGSARRINLGRYATNHDSSGRTISGLPEITNLQSMQEQPLPLTLTDWCVIILLEAHRSKASCKSTSRQRQTDAEQVTKLLLIYTQTAMDLES